MPQFSFEERLNVPAALTTLHSTLPKQSINVLTSVCTEENQLIRLLLGTATIVHNPTNKRIIQKINYSVLGCPVVSSKSYTVIEQALLAYDITAVELDILLWKTRGQRAYYKQLLSEISSAIWRTNKSEHTLAFLHIYRFLEHISFAFPLLYAARSSNFNGAFSLLKDFFSDTKAELSFFTKFIETSIEQDLRNQTAKIDFSVINTDYRHAIYTSVKNQIKTVNISSDVPDGELIVKNDGILELCINLRNRYFHFNVTNSENISTYRIGDSDDLFKLVNQPILNWLTVLYFETIKHRIKGA